MTALRIFSTNKPTLHFSPVKPMSAADEQFWRLLRQQKPHLYERNGRDG